MKKHSHDEMLSLYSDWQASGKSKTAFAVSQGIRPTTFYYWTRKFEQEESGSVSGFHRISTEDLSCGKEGELMAAIQYPSGIRLELYSSFQNLRDSYLQLLKRLTE